MNDNIAKRNLNQVAAQYYHFLDADNADDADF